MKIRKIKLRDFDELYALWITAGLRPKSKEQERKEMTLTLKLNPTSCFALIDKKQIVGSILGAFNGRRAWIYHLAIHPNYQQKGYGALLMQNVEHILSKKKATRALVAVSVGNEQVIPFYQKQGYKLFYDAAYLGKDLVL